MSGEPILKGDRAVLRQGDRSLEVFRLSDSLWWTNHRLAYADLPDGTVVLPDPDKAIALAREQLARRGLKVQAQAEPTTDYAESVMGSTAGKYSELRTAIDVDFTLSTNDRPFFGPGAKVKFTFVNDAQLAQVVYFWRRFEPSGEVTPIGPEEALARLGQDPTFSQLAGEYDDIAVQAITLGYFALPPREMQRFYVPVYAIDMSVTTDAFVGRPLRRYILALNADANQKLRMATNSALQEHF
jgi:hypothetical protein